jgi:hypothetical protein
MQRITDHNEPDPGFRRFFNKEPRRALSGPPGEVLAS